jgi:glucokinase
LHDGEGRFHVLRVLFSGYPACAYAIAVPVSRRIVTVDIGGTHARFAIATIDEGRVTGVEEPVTLRTADYHSFRSAWEEFGRRTPRRIPVELGMAFAGPVGGDLLKLTNSPWVIRPATMQKELGLERFTVVNDFGAVAQAVACLEEKAFAHVCGPDRPLPHDGVISVIGPGTGLGVASLLRCDGHVHVIETEGGHIEFASLNALEDQVLAELRRKFGRVSIERLLSGRGLLNLYGALAAIEDRQALIEDERLLWAVALDGSDSLAAAALEQLCLTLGSVAGDLALAQGAVGVAIGGGLGLRLADHLPRSGFRSRFLAKGRFECRLAAMPVKLITYSHPGLFGAAAAFARQMNTCRE